MKRKAAALLACLLLVVQLASPPARAAESVYFVAAGSNVLPMSDDTMPFWSGGYLYIASSIFTGIVWSSLGISHVPGNARQPLILYSGDDRPLMFDAGASYARDSAGNTYYPGAVERNGTTFVPASTVASFFGLQYSLIPNVEHGYLVWLRQPGYGLSDEDFADAATYPMAACYAQYLKSKERPVTPVTPPVTDPQPEEPTASGKSVYLCLEAEDTAAQLLDVLDRHGAQAAFFCSLEFLETQGDLLRRMAATGQAVGILVDGADPRRTPEEQLEAGNRALYRATFQKTRLAYVQDGDAAASQAAEAAGFRCLYPDLDRGDTPLRSGYHAGTLLRQVSARRGSVTVWLGGAVGTGGLGAFLTQAAEAEDRCLPLTETA